MTGTTVITAAGTGYTPVRLLKPLKPPYHDNDDGPAPQLSVSDPTHFVAVALVFPHSLRGWDLGTFPTMFAFAIPTGRTPRLFYFFTGIDPPPVLHPGDYRLYVIATAPERLVWHLPAGGGTRHLRVDHPTVAHRVVTVSPSLPGTGTVAPEAATYGHFPVSDRAEVLMVVWLRGRDMGDVDEINACIYDGADSVADATQAAPAPVCKGVNAGIGPLGFIQVPPPEPTGEQEILGGGVTGVDRPDKVNAMWSDFGVKISTQVSGVVDHALAMELWLNLD